MSEKPEIEIKVPQYGELRESVKQRLQRIREAFSDSRTHAEKRAAVEKLVQGRDSRSPA
ncbi:hypothetical protein ACFPK9_07105 [Rubritalea spongiae]|uniref:Uncharacterized protein n=1 Tax=Rubritalea spongiae TaxID=430797 RepID=A0ABW5E1E1_9BACT